MWLSAVSSVVSAAGGMVSSFFGMKNKQLDVATDALKVLQSANTSAEQREQAIASVVMAESSSDYWLAAVWRPLLMLSLAILVAMYIFGHVPENAMIPMPEHSPLREIFDLLKIGIMGYMPLRTLDRAIDAFARSNILKQLLSTYLKGR